MSYHERRAIVSLVSTTLVYALYMVYVLQTYPQGNPYSAEVFHFWGLAFVIFIPVSIVVNILAQIVSNIVYTMATHEKVHLLSDERDRLIALRAIRNSIYAFTLGLALAMGSLVIDMPPSVMFIMFIVSGYLSGVVLYSSQLYFYRKGF